MNQVLFLKNQKYIAIFAFFILSILAINSLLMLQVKNLDYVAFVNEGNFYIYKERSTQKNIRMPSKPENTDLSKYELIKVQPFHHFEEIDTGNIIHVRNRHNIDNSKYIYLGEDPKTASNFFLFRYQIHQLFFNPITFAIILILAILIYSYFKKYFHQKLEKAIISHQMRMITVIAVFSAISILALNSLTVVNPRETAESITSNKLNIYRTDNSSIFYSALPPEQENPNYTYLGKTPKTLTTAKYNQNDVLRYRIHLKFTQNLFYIIVFISLLMLFLYRETQAVKLISSKFNLKIQTSQKAITQKINHIKSFSLEQKIQNLKNQIITLPLQLQAFYQNHTGIYFSNSLEKIAAFFPLSILSFLFYMVFTSLTLLLMALINYYFPILQDIQQAMQSYAETAARVSKFASIFSSSVQVPVYIGCSNNFFDSFLINYGLFYLMLSIVLFLVIYYKAYRISIFLAPIPFIHLGFVVTAETWCMSLNETMAGFVAQEFYKLNSSLKLGEIKQLGENFLVFITNNTTIKESQTNPVYFFFAFIEFLSFDLLYYIWNFFYIGIMIAVTLFQNLFKIAEFNTTLNELLPFSYLMAGVMLAFYWRYRIYFILFSIVPLAQILIAKSLTIIGLSQSGLVVLFLTLPIYLIVFAKQYRFYIERAKNVNILSQSLSYEQFKKLPIHIKMTEVFIYFFRNHLLAEWQELTYRFFSNITFLGYRKHDFRRKNNYIEWKLAYAQRTLKTPQIIYIRRALFYMVGFVLVCVIYFVANIQAV